MKTVEEAARTHWSESTYNKDAELAYDERDSIAIKALAKSVALRAFKKGADWQAKQSPWISVEERLPEEGQRILVGFLYYYKYDDREAESRSHIDTFTYENGVWVNDNGKSYLGKDITRRDIKVICWQPITSFDEILEANKDVPERIKEKGD